MATTRWIGDQQGRVASWLSEEDIYLFREGRHSRLYEKFGAHVRRVGNRDGVHFAVWAPNARAVSVVGDFNGWRAGAHPLRVRVDSSGIWEGFIPDLGVGALYKYHLVSRDTGYAVEKADPFAFLSEPPPRTASIVSNPAYQWSDQPWMARREAASALNAAIAIYEMHLGSWRRVPEEGDRMLTYREIAARLPAYLVELGFTHVEFMPVTEHPFYGSWGYQTTGYFAPTARYGAPADFALLIDALHQHGIAVILDWVPSHFPTDQHGLGYFDGTHLFEHADAQQGFHPEWNSSIFNYGRDEVRSILISSAAFWLDRYHIDGLRVDGVASMLYRDYARKPGEWIPNAHGGRENEEAIRFVRALNESVYGAFPGTQTFAEESTAWPMVSRPTDMGGLGFGFKWNMGWMHDTLDYFRRDPVWRRYHQGQWTFSIWYAFHENFVLPLSHDEVVHGKGSLLDKMPGDRWQKFANLRLLFGYMYAHPGKKLLFMGSEIAQWQEWSHDRSLDWHLMEYADHQGITRLVCDLNRLYRTQPALHERDFDTEGFQWADMQDAEQSVISFYRQARDIDDAILIICNATPVPRVNYRLGVAQRGFWQELLNTDANIYGGGGWGNMGGVETVPVGAHRQQYSLTLTLPPLGVLYLKRPARAKGAQCQ
ncbi:MAG: 1,4-alpha-glucan branching protein GlgB [Acidiferrobacter sp.]